MVVAGRTSTGTVVEVVLVVLVVLVDVVVELVVLVVELVVLVVVGTVVLVVELVVVGTVVLVVELVVLVVVGTVVLVVELVVLVVVVELVVLVVLVVVVGQSGGRIRASEAVAAPVRTGPSRSVIVANTSLSTLSASSQRGTLVCRQISGGGPLKVTCSWASGSSARTASVKVSLASNE
jgi:hypothetical protein